MPSECVSLNGPSLRIKLILKEKKNGTLRVVALNALAVQVLKSCAVGDPGTLVFTDVDAARLSVYTRRVFASVGIADASFVCPEK